ncbi:MAG: hypothetical protein H7249_09535 [Chitinophagaceae bacterium]|nr:hypothetical protein [Oligoflexus sp.]
MFDENDTADDSVMFDSSAGAKVPVTAVASPDDEVMSLLNGLSSAGPFVMGFMDYEAIDPAQSGSVVLFKIRMMEAFEDLGLIRSWRQKRPLQPIIALSPNDDEDFVLEAFKAGVTNYLPSTVPVNVLSAILKSYHKMGEAPRLVEIQNSEMIRSLETERKATEARLQAESARQMADLHAIAHAQTREILDNLTEGFFIVNVDLSIGAITSKSCNSIFGQGIANQDLGAALGLEAGKENYLRGCLEQLFEDFMPLEVNRSLLPKNCRTTDGRTLSFTYTPILDQKGVPEKVIVAVVDITSEVLAQKTLERLTLRSEILFRILSDKESFKDFLESSKHEIASLKANPSIIAGKRILHTLKGNTAVMGLVDVADGIHGMESRLEDDSTCGTEQYFSECADTIESGFLSFLNDNKQILHIDWHLTETQVSLPRSAIAALLNYVQESTGPGKSEVEGLLAKTKLRTISSMLSGYGEIAEKIGARLGKEIRFKVIGEDLRIDPDRYGPLLKSLIHALRNSCDHGIETVEERLERGKKASGLITFKFTYRPEGGMKITLSDSGRGIPLHKILKKAVQCKIVKAEETAMLTVKDVLHLIFHDGFSTAEHISETSGRGVGMAAIKYEVDALGGTIRIATKPHKGTVFELLLPA